MTPTWPSCFLFCLAEISVSSLAQPYSILFMWWPSFCHFIGQLRYLLGSLQNWNRGAGICLIWWHHLQRPRPETSVKVTLCLECTCYCRWSKWRLKHVFFFWLGWFHFCWWVFFCWLIAWLLCQVKRFCSCQISCHWELDFPQSEDLKREKPCELISRGKF